MRCRHSEDGKTTTPEGGERLMTKRQLEERVAQLEDVVEEFKNLCEEALDLQEDETDCE